MGRLQRPLPGSWTDLTMLCLGGHHPAWSLQTLRPLGDWVKEIVHISGELKSQAPPSLRASSRDLGIRGYPMPAELPLALRLADRVMVNFRFGIQSPILNVLRLELLTSSPYIWHSPASTSPISDGKQSHVRCTFPSV